MPSKFFDKFVPFSQRQDVWGDVQPLKQYDTETGAAPICPVAYSPDYEEAAGYFRAILASNELSLPLDLTVDILKFNPGDYDAWALRRKIIDHLNLPLTQELEFLNEIGTYLEKNFQIWHHRRCIMELHQQDFQQEKEFLEEIFYSDKKNYHAWSYKLWFIERFQLWDEDEWRFIDEELDDEVTNNSLWSYRYFLVNKTNAALSQEIIESEIKYALNKLELDYSNEATWVYLRGYLANSVEEAEKSQNSNAKRWIITDFPFLQEYMQGLLNSSTDKNMHSFKWFQVKVLLKILLIILKKHISNRFIYSVQLDFAIAENKWEEAVKILELLKKIDRMRENFYQWRINQINEKLQKQN